MLAVLKLLRCDVLDNVRADGGLEHLREGVRLLAGLAIGGDDGNNRPARHLCCARGG